jgi:glycosyltransferase involved in cell wall biosynthesis
MNVDVTVCVMSLNRPAFLTEALHSVLRQTVSPKTIAVFDAGSTPEILASLKKEFTICIDSANPLHQEKFFAKNL